MITELIAWWPAAAAVTAALTLALATRAARRDRWTSETAQTILTVAAAGIATGVAVTGMWRVFDDALGIHSIAGKIALSAFLEIALLASARTAPRSGRWRSCRASSPPGTSTAVWRRRSGWRPRSSPHGCGSAAWRRTGALRSPKGRRSRGGSRPAAWRSGFGWPTRPSGPPVTWTRPAGSPA